MTKKYQFAADFRDEFLKKFATPKKDPTRGRGVYVITDLGLTQVQENCFAYPIL